ncbi:MAG: FecR family protein [Ignavibacteriaceae bacterium]
MKKDRNFKERTVDSQFLVRVLRGEITSEEREYFNQWLLESEKNKEEFSTISLIWDKAGDSVNPPVPDAESQWNILSSKVFFNDYEKTQVLQEEGILSNPTKIEPLIPVPQADPGEAGKKEYTRHPGLYKKNFGWIIRIAAILLIALGLNYLSSLGKYEVKDISQKPPEITKTKIYELVALKGERKTFPLADGTIVYLNADSKLRYPQHFEGSYREVEIQGEAYFSVKPNNEQPFKVVSGKTTVLVTGTEFNIKNRNNNIYVVVTQGNIITYSSRTPKSYNLGKGQMITYSERKGFSEPTYVEVEKYLGWRNNKFFFESTPLKDVMAEIERFYNVKVVFSSDSLKHKTITGTFNGNSLDKIFSIICLTLDVKINYNGKNVLVF